MEEHDRIELRSDDVQEIIGTPPRWIVRWGTLIVALSVLAMVSMSFFVKYPDKVKGRVTVTSKVAAVRVKAQQSGRISKIFFEDGDEVMEGDLLVIMQNAANYEDVEELEEIAKALQSADKMELLEFLSSDFKQLDVGTLQPLYSKVENDFENFHFTEMNRSGDKQIFQIRNQIASIRSGINILKRQLKGAEDNVKIEMRKYER
ncbi:MAG TPA: biotin/lipoyl-binding protein, partial [Phaeodactylibacter sp.]|nr:biotin/lipoyl-binding protein [Phaeodactylibacter sp.]